MTSLQETSCMNRIPRSAIVMASLTRYPISALPLPPPSKLLIHNLTPAPATTSVSPFPLPFPYEIEPPENPPDDFDKEEYVDQWLATRESSNPKPEEGRRQTE